MFTNKQSATDALRSSSDSHKALKLYITASRKGGGAQKLPTVDGAALRPHTTFMLRLTGRTTVTINIERPSRDFLALGLFLISLQVMDGILTSLGVARYGVQAEGNPLLSHLMLEYGADQVLWVVKAAAVAVVTFMTIQAKRVSWVKDIIGVLSCIYLSAAIIPWIIVLFYS